jgi:mono/diheme cytochrome c family protein
MSSRPSWLLPTVVGLWIGLLGLAAYEGVGWLRKKPSVVRTVESAALPTPPVEKVSAPAQQAAQDLARKAAVILQTNCHRCHGQDGAVEGGFNYVLDSARLTARKKIVPGRPDQSVLLQRIRDGEMPPAEERQRPGADDVVVLERWIEAGAPALTTDRPARPPLTPTQVVPLIQADLGQRPERERRFTRYFTITHLDTAGLAEDELQTYRQALSKLVNSLSWGRDIVVPQPIDTARTVLRIDLRDLKWSDRVWNRILADYPYGSVPSSDAERAVAAVTDSRLAYVRADWFTAFASRPPLYYALLELPGTTGELEALLRVDAAENIRSERVLRSGFANSGVSRFNRIIERHESSYGAYWKSYDFGSGIGKRNVFAHPLGPALGENSFQPDGGEIIFDLPNGMHAFFLTDGAGKRLDQAPLNVVSDPKRPEHAVLAGLSCMSCHYRGLNNKADQVREHVRKNASAFSDAEADSVRALYPPRERFEGVLRGDNERFRKALVKTGARWGSSDPITALTARFEADLDLTLAAAEAGVKPEELRSIIAATPELGRSLGVLRAPGGTVSRALFADTFPALLRSLKHEKVQRLSEPTVLSSVKERVVVDLPEPFEQVRSGGGGRFLIFHLKKARKLAIFDVLQAKIVREIDLPDDDVRFAAGRDKLLIVLPGQKLIQRWSLQTFAREKTVPVPDDRPVRIARMGSDAPGPLGLWTGGKIILLDVEKMAPLDVEGRVIEVDDRWGSAALQVSADGQTFLGWLANSSNQVQVMRLHGRRTTLERAEGADFNEWWVLPNADGSLLLRFDHRVVGPDLKPISAEGLKDRVLLPTTDPRFFLAFRGEELSVCTSGDRQPVVTFKEPALQGMSSSTLSTRWGQFAGEPRINYLPAAHLLVFVREGNKQIVVRPFNLIEELEQGGRDYLFVQSQPKTRAKRGSDYVYPLDVKSKAGGVTFRLEKGPEGMTVSPAGELRWNATPPSTEKAASVIVHISNAAGTELFHSFDIVVE